MITTLMRLCPIGFISTIIVAIMFLPTVATSQINTSVSPIDAATLVASMGGYIDDAVVINEHAYIGEGSSLTVVDISNPQMPTLVARLPLGQTIKSLVISNTIAYVLVSDALITVDISTPTSPTRLSSKTIDVFGQEIVVEGNYVYIDGFGADLLVMDVTEPDNPISIGQLGLDGRPLVLDIAIQQDIAYVAFRNPSDESTELRGGVYIVDVSDPANPNTLHVHELPDGATDIQVDDQFVYVGYSTNDTAFIQVLDVTTLTEPQQLQTLPIDATDYTLAINNDYLAIGSLSNIIVANRVLDGTLEIRTTIDVSYRPEVLILDHSQLYTVSNGASTQFAVFTIQNDDPPTMIGNIAFVGEAETTEIQNTTMYLGGRALQVVDIQQFQQPELLATYESNASISEMIVDGEMAYLATSSGLEIVDVSQPAQPVRRGMWTSQSFAPFHIAKQDTTIYVVTQTTHNANVIEFDVSNPINPSQVTSLLLDGIVSDIYGTEQYLYAIVDSRSGPKELVVIDWRTSPLEIVATVEIDGRAQHIAQHESYLYIGGNRIETLDISDLTNPRVTSTRPLRSFLTQLVVADSYLYGIESGVGMVRFPIIDGYPQRPKAVLRYPESDMSTALQVVGDRVFLSQGAGGIQMYQATDPGPTNIFLPLISR